MADLLGITWPYDIKTLLYGAIFIMLVTTIILLFTLAAHTTYIELQEERFKKLQDFYERALLQKLADSSFHIKIPHSKVEFDALAEVLSQMIAGASGEIEKLLKEYARELGVAEFYKNMVGSRSWLKRFIAVEKLGLLKLPEMRAVFYHVLESEKDTGVLAKAVWAISFTLDEADLDVVNRVLDRPFFMSAKFAEYIYINIINAFRHRGMEARFVSYLKFIKDDKGISGALKRAIIEACGSAKLYSAKDIVMDYYRQFNQEPQMRITCLRALGELGGKDVLEAIRSGLNDADWRVRAVAAKSASICPEAIAGDLRACLYDSNYNVRLNAALSLSKLGDIGLSALEHEIDSDDRFVYDVTRFVLKELSLRA